MDWAAGWATFVGVGIALGAVGVLSAVGRLPRNGLVGIRISSTMASDQAWERGHLAAAPVAHSRRASQPAGSGRAVGMAAPAGRRSRCGGGRNGVDLVPGDRVCCRRPRSCTMTPPTIPEIDGDGCRVPGNEGRPSEEAMPGSPALALSLVGGSVLVVAWWTRLPLIVELAGGVAFVSGGVLFLVSAVAASRRTGQSS